MKLKKVFEFSATCLYQHHQETPKFHGIGHWLSTIHIYCNTVPEIEVSSFVEPMVVGLSSTLVDSRRDECALVVSSVIGKSNAIKIRNIMAS